MRHYRATLTLSSVVVQLVRRLPRMSRNVKPAASQSSLGFSRSPAPRRNRNLAHELVESIGDRIRDGRLTVGQKLPTEAEIMVAFGVSRTVVREALSKLQAAGQVRTQHGIGTFVVGPGEATPFRIRPDQLATLQDVVAMLELRIGLETEAAALAAQRRGDEELRELRAALDEFAAAVESGREAVAADLRFHLGIARATQNPRFAELMGALGVGMIPRARLDDDAPTSPERREFLRRVNAEHENIYDAIAAGDSDAARAAMRTHLSSSRERRRRAQVESVPAIGAAADSGTTRRRRRLTGASHVVR
jgi:GntR family transcriptional repressor for pyruvate dehydrogenase complex